MQEPSAPLYQHPWTRHMSTLTNKIRTLAESENTQSEMNEAGSSQKLTMSASPSQTKYECPSCFGYLLPPIYQCRHGHTLCNSCVSNFKRCPTCHKDLPTKKIRSLVLEELAVGLRYDCKNRHLGCSVTNLKFDQISKHLSNCLFVAIPYCALLNLKCREKFTAGNIIEHLKSAHSITGLEFKSEEGCNPYIQIFQAFPKLKMKLCKKTSFVFDPHYFKWNDKIFFLKSNFDAQENTFSWMVCRAGEQESDENESLFTSIKLMSEVGSYCSLEWRGQIGSLRTQFGHNAFSFSVPVKTAKMIGIVSSDGFEWCLRVRLIKRNNIPSIPILIVPQLQPLSSSSLLPSQGQQRQTSGDYSALTRAAIDVANNSTPPPVPARHHALVCMQNGI